MHFNFDLQLFGGSSSSSTTSTYTPSEYELQLQKAQANYADAIAPNSLWLNDTARNILQDSIGSVKVDFNGLNNTAQDQISQAQSGLSALPGMNAEALSSANSTLGQLQNGQLPSSYLQNMTDAIKTGVTNTVGSNVNDLGNRGVLNSSVTNKALNDIEGNVSDTMAKSYTDNIGTVAGLANNQLSNTLNATNDTANIFNNQISNATAPITTAASAQEAAQTPATNLWNASLGLNSSTTGALAAAAGKGTTTNMTTQSNSGGLLSGLLTGASLYGTFCFTAGTKIAMASGGLRSIEKIKTGDMVKTHNGKAMVIEVMKPHDNYVFTVSTDSGKITETTLTQPLMKKDGSYILVGDLTIGTELMNAGRVMGINYKGFSPVYDLQVDGDNNYLADGFVAQGGGRNIWEGSGE